MPVDPILPAAVAPVAASPAGILANPEWRIDHVEQPGAAAQAAAPVQGGFGGLLGEAIGALTKTQQDAAAGAQALAAGTVEDPTTVVMAVERAQLAMQLASQVRNKVVEAAQDLFHTQV